MRFEYLISKTRGERKGMAGSPEKGKDGPSCPDLTSSRPQTSEMGEGRYRGFSQHQSPLLLSSGKKVPLEKLQERSREEVV